MNTKALILIGAGVALALYGGKVIRALAPANTSGVTTSTKGGSLTTTPIKTSAVAFVSRFNSLPTGSNAAASVVPSSVVQLSKLDAFQPFGSPIVARAAYTAPIRPQYAPTPYANLQAR